jgi:hypothetical protein
MEKTPQSERERREDGAAQSGQHTNARTSNGGGNQRSTFPQRPFPVRSSRPLDRRGSNGRSFIEANSQFGGRIMFKAMVMSSASYIRCPALNQAVCRPHLQAQCFRLGGLDQQLVEVVGAAALAASAISWHWMQNVIHGTAARRLG